MATLCITAAHRRWVKFRGSKRRAKTFASSLVKHGGRFSQIVIKNYTFYEKTYFKHPKRKGKILNVVSFWVASQDGNTLYYSSS